MIFNRFILSAIALLASHLTVGVIGYLGARNYYLLQIEQIRTDAQIELAKAIADKNEKEHVFSKALITTQSKIALSNDRIAAVFSSLNAWGDSNFITDNTVSLHNSQNNAGCDSDMSSTATTTRAVSDCECRCDGKDQAKLRRLYQEQLIIARDCDITASHYNELIRYYESVSQH